MCCLAHTEEVIGLNKFKKNSMCVWWTLQDHWKYDAFAAVKDAEGNIYGRGSQDMKSVTIQWVEPCVLVATLSSVSAYIPKHVSATDNRGFTRILHLCVLQVHWGYSTSEGCREDVPSHPPLDVCPR